ncbi:MAG: scytonemin biosynthesis cyclase/decarboxylase ScyC [Moorea sp. SIO1F2]|uniref:scytonemin biosynthesis cyclase/decarboxylase ScyC n=1 Tax=Moorena sp. SIO1F2 TaxID=2607819 RepID=UPI0013B5FBA2|nr:scytonemin biosynthesis cyclase/decarboxylase ScyC [Moorena sp. SIO1F2]NET85779.1 scytonemin biosynthesis cyclase/decarboxylase ScyC [Moorena sp. SIO1F2]
MEENTFPISTYIATSLDKAFEYLCCLENLNEWTLFSRMLEKIDENTWLGTASCYQNKLYYHLRKINTPLFRGIEWHCGIEYENYFQVYPVLLFPPNYLEPNSDEEGVYFHWVSFVDPNRRTGMMKQAIGLVHTSECRSLKGNLERNAGHTSSVKGRYTLDTDTIYIDAPIELGVEYLTDVKNIREWAHLLSPNGDINSQSGQFIDEYGQTVQVAIQVHDLNNYYLLEQDFFYPDFEFTQRCPTILIPCSYGFGDPSARGFIQHRITFWKVGEVPTHGKLQIEDYEAESINIKRLLEAQAGNKETFARGMSYLPRS